MTVDPNLPLELDDGTPVQRVVTRWDSPNPTSVRVRIPKSFLRDGSERPEGGAWNYYLAGGNWIGGSSSTHYTIRNTANAFEPEEYEAFFV